MQFSSEGREQLKSYMTDLESTLKYFEDKAEMAKAEEIIQLFNQ